MTEEEGLSETDVSVSYLVGPLYCFLSAMSFPIYQVKKEEPEEEPTHTSARLPQIVSVVSASAAVASVECPRIPGNPSAGDNVPPTKAPSAEKESSPVSSYASPAWYYFGVPGGSSNLQREPIVYCLLCQVQVKRGTVPGKLGTTCLYTHLERRHNLTREEVFNTAAAAGYCGPIITPTPPATPATQTPTTTPAAQAPTATPSIQTWECSSDGSGLVLVPVKRSGASPAEQSEGRRVPKRPATMAPATSSEIPELTKCQTTTAPATSSEPTKTPNVARRQPAAAPVASSGPPATPDLSKCQALTAPATSSGPSKASELSSRPSCSRRRQQSRSQSRALSSSYRQALHNRLLSSVHMYCEVCHALILSGERSQSARDLALETHFSSQHPCMFNRLKRGAARDARLGGLGPSSVVPSGSHSGKCSPSPGAQSENFSSSSGSC